MTDPGEGATGEASDDVRRRVAEAVLQFIAALSLRDDAATQATFSRSRVDRGDAYRVMDEYGGCFGIPPAGAYDHLDLGAVIDEVGCFAVDAALWDGAGAETDLSAILLARLRAGRIEIELCDLRVM